MKKQITSNNQRLIRWGGLTIIVILMSITLTMANNSWIFEPKASKAKKSLCDYDEFYNGTLCQGGPLPKGNTNDDAESDGSASYSKQSSHTKKPTTPTVQKSFWYRFSTGTWLFGR